MDNHFTKQGLLYGASAVIITLVLYFSDPGIMINYTSWVVYLIALYFMVMAVQNARNQNDGFIGLGDAFKQGWLVFVIGISIHTAFTYVFYNFVDVSLLDVLREAQVEALDKMAKTFNMNEADIEKARSGIENENPFNLKSIFIALPVSFLFPGSLMAIVIAAITKKDNPSYSN